MDIGYCTNVHSGFSLVETRQQLETHATEVRERLGLKENLPIGLWLSAPSAESVLKDQGVDEFADWLANHHLTPYTINGFPYGNFHDRVVKHQVYLPTWMEPERLRYTKNLAEILAGLSQPGAQVTISTLPIAWGQPELGDAAWHQACRHLVELATYLASLQESSGRRIQVCIEPEPGCVLDRCDDIVALFQRLDEHGAPELVREYLAVCHDICHSAVMYEPQREVLERYRSEGISIGKVQVSSAISLQRDTENWQAGLSQLESFAEDRYLHQTSVRNKTGSVSFFEDLPQALDLVRNEGTDGNEAESIRVHFHLPIYRNTFDHLMGTQDQISECVETLRSLDVHPQYEVETYAWNVLPKSHQCATLATGIAEELRWFNGLIDQAK